MLPGHQATSSSGPGELYTKPKLSPFIAVAEAQLSTLLPILPILQWHQRAGRWVVRERGRQLYPVLCDSRRATHRRAGWEQHSRVAWAGTISGYIHLSWMGFLPVNCLISNFSRLGEVDAGYSGLRMNSGWRDHVCTAQRYRWSRPSRRLESRGDHKWFLVDPKLVLFTTS